MTEPAGTPANAVRATSKTGGAKDVKIERFDQIPAGPLAELAARYGIGSLKYPQVNGLDNWRNGYPWSYSYRALLGHANAFWGGEDVDPAAYLGTDDPRALIDGVPRPGVTHLAAVAWHALALLHWAETHPEYDDRESTVLARQKAGLSGLEEELVERTLDSFDDEDLDFDGSLFIGPARPWEDIGWTTDGGDFFGPVKPADGSVGAISGEFRTEAPGFGLISGDPGDAFRGQPVTFEKAGVDGAFTRIHIPNAELVNEGDGKIKVIPHPSQAETPQLELDEHVLIKNTPELAFVGDQYGTVVAIKRDGMAVRYDVRLSAGGYTLLDLKPSQLVKQ
jgi:dATP/dGTP diphosphohydrolase